MRAPARLVVLISGRGRNLQALIDAIDGGRLAATVEAVVSNRAKADGLRRARRAGLATRILRPADYADRGGYDAALTAAVQAYEPDWVVLAGYMRILGSSFVQHFAGRMVNIHPSLLPKHRGLDTHRRVLAAGDSRHGASVHFVTEGMDAGPVLLQGSVAVTDNDTEHRLAQRVMDKVETRIYPQALGWLVTGRAVYNDGKIRFDDQLLEDSIHVECD